MKRGDYTGYPEIQNLIEDGIARAEKASQSAASAASVGGFGDLQFFGTQPVSIRKFKGKAFPTLKVTIPSGVKKLKVVLEQYSGAGPTVTVIDRFEDADKEIPDTIVASGGIFTFEFGLGLPFNANFGGLKLVAFMFNGSIVKNPATDPVDSPRLLADYLPGSTFSIGGAFNSPSAPSLSLVSSNRLDSATPEYDAILTTKVYAPLTDAGAAQSWGDFVSTLNHNDATVRCLFDHYSGPSFITAATNASPIVLTAVAHGMSTGDTGLVAGVLGNTAANGTWTVTRVDADHLSLNGSTGNGSYTSGGTIAKLLEKIVGHRDLQGTDLTQTDSGSTPANRGYVLVPRPGLGVGTHLQWYRNVVRAANGEESTADASPSIDIYAGLSEAGNGIPELTSTSFTFAPIDGDGKHIHAYFNFTQPSSPVALKKYFFYKAKASDYSDVERVSHHSLRLDDYNQTGAIQIDLDQVKIKPSVDNYFRIVIVASSGATRTFDFSNTASAKYTAGSGTEVPADTAVVSAPSAPVVIATAENIHVKCIKPSSNFNQFVKNEIVFKAKHGVTVDGYLQDSSGAYVNAGTSEVPIDIGPDMNRHFAIKKSSVQTLFPSATDIDIFNYITNGFGRSSAGSARTLNIATWTVDNVVQDSAAVSTPAAPTVVGHPRHIKLKVTKPTSQWNQPVKVEIVAQVKNSGGSIIGYIVDGQPPTNSATKFYNDEITNLEPAYKWAKDAITNLYPTGSTIEFFARLTNGFGVSVDGTVTVFTISTWTADVIDAIAPGGTLTAPTIRQLKRSGLKLDLTAPTLGIVNLRRANVYIANGTHSTATLWLAASNLTSSTGTEANGAIQTNPTGGVSIVVDKTTLEAVFGTGATITIYATWTNDVGTSGFSNGTTYNLATGETGAVGFDSAVPTLASPSAPTVAEYFGEFKCSAPLPTANINTLDTFQFVISTQNTAPVANPSIGSEGVQQILYGQFCSFNRSLASSSTLYVYYRAHNQVGYSLWSTGTSQSNFSRPLQDVIGDAVPIPPERLEYNNNSGTGHTSTTFVLDSGASAVDDFYNGMLLHLSAFDTGTTNEKKSSVRVISDYVGSTRTATISVAFDSTPSGSVAFEIHRITVTGDRGGRSGTGHSTTNFVLESGASAVDDFYNGYTIFVPTLSSGRIRKVTDYVGSTRTCTLESALSGTPVDNSGYMLVNGSFGWQNPDLTGIISPAPFRTYLDGDNDVNIVETLTPTGGNAFSLTDLDLQYWKSNGTPEFKKDYLLSVSIGTTFDSIPAPISSTAQRSVRLRYRNLYRGSGSDGWSTFSSYVQVDHSTSSTSPGVPNYAPGTYPPKLIDFQGEDSYPGGRYNYA